MPTLYGHNYQLQELEALWAPYYDSVARLMGANHLILPFGDPKYGQPDATTFTTASPNSSYRVTFTWSEAPASFDTPLDLTSSASYKGLCPILTANGTDEEADSPDAAIWSVDDAGGANGFNFTFWVKPTTGDNMWLLSKDDLTDREWSTICLSTGDLLLDMHDDSASANSQRTSDVAVTSGVWQQWGFTYEGSGGATNANEVVIYRNGVAFASSATYDGGYVGFEDLTSVVTFLKRGNNSGYYLGDIAGGPCGPTYGISGTGTGGILTAAEMYQYYTVTRRLLGV